MARDGDACECAAWPDCVCSSSRVDGGIEGFPVGTGGASFCSWCFLASCSLLRSLLCVCTHTHTHTHTHTRDNVDENEFPSIYMHLNSSTRSCTFSSVRSPTSHVHSLFALVLPDSRRFCGANLLATSDRRQTRRYRVCCRASAQRTAHRHHNSQATVRHFTSSRLGPRV